MNENEKISIEEQKVIDDAVRADEEEEEEEDEYEDCRFYGVAEMLNRERY